MDRVEQLEAALRACLEDRKRYARKLYQARALLREPPLLVLDSLLARLPDAAYATVAELLNDYPGVLIFSGELPGISETASWEARA